MLRRWRLLPRNLRMLTPIRPIRCRPPDLAQAERLWTLSEQLTGVSERTTAEEGRQRPSHLLEEAVSVFSAHLSVKTCIIY